MSDTTFQGFTGETADFLWELSFHNERPWFQEHREEYLRVLHVPFHALAADTATAMRAAFPEANFDLHVSRIYRDARTLNGRGPLNDHMWFSLGRTGRVYAVEPQFYFGVEARCCQWGLGYWNAGAEMMERWRRSIDANPARLSRIVRRVDRMEGMERYGPTYKRPKGDPGPLLFDWYNARTPGVDRMLWFDGGTPGPELADTVAADFIQLMPLYEYFLSLGTE